jgi:uncharacterized oxidoreductase
LIRRHADGRARRRHGRCQAPTTSYDRRDIARSRIVDAHTPPSDATIRIGADRLREFVRTVCASAGCDAEEAGAIAQHLVDANLTGHDSHGVGMLVEYIPAMRDGRLKLGRRARITRDSGPVIVIDAGVGVGQVLGREAMAIGIERARLHGVALVALQRAHHLGRIGAWAEQCAAAGCASLHYVNVIGHRPYVAPFGGTDGRLATNPVCIGLPATDQPPIILDMATSKVAFGKVKVARNRGQPVPDGALIDAAGVPTNDPAVMFAQPSGALLPFGEHKGYGLAVMCDLLAGALVGGGTNGPDAQTSDTITNNMLSIIIDPAAVTETDAMHEKVAVLTAWLKASPPRAGVDGVLLPGEPERRIRAERERMGIPLDRNTWRQLEDMARLAGCDPGMLPES